jgi:hypothetical protein
VVEVDQNVTGTNPQEQFSMAKENDAQTHNQPSHEAQMKGGQHSHQGAQQGSHESTSGQPNQGSATHKAEDGRSRNQPSHEAQVKGGQRSHSGSEKK